ncbi:hypothetical protein CBM2609_P260001 [Cupriavidus taiwanensis]|nr:hypothetical protein CBM2609_P260001 [Cupriavidus taiwanensis]SOZ50955.1 hypothetical protein CBM2610_P240001 [Cupriavidus taiwanensis]
MDRLAGAQIAAIRQQQACGLQETSGGSVMPELIGLIDPDLIDDLASLATTWNRS